MAELEDQVDDLQFKLDRIKNNPLWKASAPARKCMHFIIRRKDRLKNCGSLSGVVQKMRYKAWEKKAMTHYGTASFPTQEERDRQERAVFERMPKISILVPLWNTPQDFLQEMIGSVQKQTYGNWELCLADGSDDDHAYEMCIRDRAGTVDELCGPGNTERACGRIFDRCGFYRERQRCACSGR